MPLAERVGREQLVFGAGRKDERLGVAHEHIEPAVGVNEKCMSPCKVSAKDGSVSCPGARVMTVVGIDPSAVLLSTVETTWRSIV